MTGKSRKKKVSLKTILICPYVALVICLAIAIGLLSYRTGSHAVKTVSEHLLQETVSRISQAVDRHVVGSVAALKTAFPEGMPAPASIESDFDSILTRLWIATSLHSDPNNYVYYGNIAGQAIGLYRHSNQLGELRVKYRAEDHRQRFNIEGLGGVPQFQSVEKELFDPRVRPWFQVARSTQKDIWTSVYIDFGTLELVSTRARRVLAADGTLAGVVATDMSLRSLNDFVGSLNISPNGLAFIIEPNGDLIASTVSPNIKTLADGQRVRVNAADSGHPLLNRIYQQLKSELSAGVDDLAVTTFFFDDDNGEQINVGFDLFEDNAGLKWVNVVALPDRDFMGGISQNVMLTVMIAVLATILVVLIGLRILHWVTTDLNTLSVAVNKVGSGLLEEPISIRRNDEIGMLATSFRAMQYRLQTDHLTGLPNRYAFEQMLNAAVEKSKNSTESEKFAIFFVDINDFKLVNDCYGHDAGDQALIELALRLRTNVRQEDFVARYAGDEFVVLLEGIQSRSDLRPIRKTLEVALAQPLISLEKTISIVSGAIGEAFFPEDGDNPQDLLVCADKRMYIHKDEIKHRRKMDQQQECSTEEDVRS
ncbi:diguanylate cyclase domain-containing protein [uncultured Desulfuromusa sp.]|uniref:sensor domain-containing diguanylate cyclase n=1 Tax=uncultured Desulfuromusa sp. TaxID=219183 RepID=UPI002AA6D79F|nr:diguanylate cyclase [uncultured Desulfuromusa sp.]